MRILIFVNLSAKLVKSKNIDLAPTITFRNRSIMLDKVPYYLRKKGKKVFSPYEWRAIEIIGKWMEGDEIFTISTSGSTGQPKEIRFTRAELEVSAQRTIDHFHLNHSDHALICINVGFIGGLMMIIRSLVAKMDMTILEPTSDPMSQLDAKKGPTFMAVVPMQLGHVVDHYLQEEGAHRKVKAIIVGGASIDAQNEAKAKQIKIPVYHTFGMTETASHFAVRRINGSKRSDIFQSLRGWKVKCDDENRLLVNWGLTGSEWLITNDIVEMVSSRSFKWLGRADNVINSGGIKIHPEILEKTIRAELLNLGIDCRFFVVGLRDPNLGDKMALFLEGQSSWKETIHRHLEETLPKYHSPREVFCPDDFVETPTGKVDRPGTVEKTLSE